MKTIYNCCLKFTRSRFLYVNICSFSGCICLGLLVFHYSFSFVWLISSISKFTAVSPQSQQNCVKHQHSKIFYKCTMSNLVTLRGQHHLVMIVQFKGSQAPHYFNNTDTHSSSLTAQTGSAVVQPQCMLGDNAEVGEPLHLHGPARSSLTAG